MNYTVPDNRIIKTSKKLETIYRPTQKERQIREYCRSHNFSIKINKETGEPYAIALKGVR